MYSWPLADEVTWANIWESLQYIIKTKTTLGKARQIQSSLNRGDLRGLWNTRGYCFSLDVKNTYDQPLPLLFVLSFTHELWRSCSIISMGRSFRDCLMFKKYFLLLFSCYADPVPVVQRELLDQLREPPHARPRESNTHMRYGMNVRRSIGEVVNCGILKSESIIRGVKSKTI